MSKLNYRAAVLVLAALCLVGPERARADSVVPALPTSVSVTNLVLGTQSVAYAFSAPSSGRFSVQLTNIDWPEKLSTLSFVASTTTSVLATLGTPDDRSSTVFDVSGPGTYFAHIFASASALNPGDANSPYLGAYSLKISFSPVPLPAAIWMMLAAILAIVVLFGRPMSLEPDSPLQRPAVQ